MNLKTFYAAAALLTAAVPVTAKTVMTVNPGDSEKTVVITDVSVLDFGTAGQMEFRATPESAPISFSLKDIESIRFESNVVGLVTVTDETSPFRLRNNPVGHMLEIDGTIDQDAALEIFSLKGSCVVSVPLWTGQAIDVSALTPGLYILKINNITLKFIKS